MTTQELMHRAKAAAPSLALADTETKNQALFAMSRALLENTETILSENEKDITAAKDKLGNVMIDRLRLTNDRIAAMAKGIEEVAALPDPVGCVIESKQRPNGLLIRRVTVPLGVIAIIYESRPNVTSDASALALKAGNACILRSGKDAYRSAKAITAALKKGVAAVSLCEDLIGLVEDPTHQGAEELMNGVGLIDLLIPRGGAGLINRCVSCAKVPCLETGTGICHIYVDKSADFEMALRILENAKTSRPSVCNAAEVCLVHRDIADKFLPLLQKRLTTDRSDAGKKAVTLITDPAAYEIIGGTKAEENSFDTEFLDYKLAVSVVSSTEEAIRHIARHSTGHSESIISEDPEAAERFLREVDSAAVYHNASTRFTDGGEFGLGCEMGISTQKMHARGPVGLTGLVSYKYIIEGSGQIR